MGDVLAVLREVRHWSQKELAAAMAMRAPTISDYERGKTLLYRETLESMVEVMGLPRSAIDWTISFLRRFTALGPGGPAEAEGRIAAVAAEIGFEVEDFFHGLLERALREARALADQEMAPALWARLQPYSLAQRQAIIREGEKYRSWALACWLCEESVRVAADSAARARELAELALFIAEQVPGSETWRAALLGWVYAFLGNAQRVGGDLPAAAAAFTRSADLWQRGAAERGPLEEVRLLDLEASLRREQRRLPEALALLDRALAADRTGTSRARLLILRAKTLEELGRYEEAVGTLRSVLPSIDGVREPRLLLVVRLNLLEVLQLLGQNSTVEELLPEVQALTVQLGNELDQVRLSWVEARLAASLGRLGEAEAAFQQVCREFFVRGITYDAALVTLEPGREAWRWRLAGYAWAFVGNAHRVCGDLPAAEAAFQRSAELWRQGAAEPGSLSEVRLLELEASLRREQRRLPEALILLNRALAADHAGASKGRLLIKRAKTLEELGDYEEAVANLGRALPFVDGECDPRLALVVHFNLLEALQLLGQQTEVEERLPYVRDLTARLGNQLDLLRLRWVEARVAAARGRSAEALAGFEEVRGEFTARGIAYDAALVTLEL
ncbi:MAG TPA: helix-turn-helix domain-containing protein, partial [Thermoanaerobaculia bacterium]|nr:helix-turn-helix domain-containing protein [Thermoanaerobaculia bacterium]